MTKVLTQAIRDEATTWFVRSQSDEFGVEDWRALQAWLEADPAHADAYAEAEALWVEFDEADAQPTVVRIASRAPKVSRGWLAIGAALAASLAVAVLIGVRTASPPPAPAPTVQAQAYATLPGERKSVVLQDGTQVMLNGDTRLAAVFAGAERRVTMTRGEAIFDVTHDPARPFLIALGDRQVRVIGTRFDILRLPAKLAVTVERGIVAVEPAGGAGGDPHRLVAGQQLIHKDGEAASVVRSVDPDQPLAWRSGRLSYNQAPLSDVGSDLGRYLGKPVSVDADIAAMPFTGVLNMDGEALVLRRLETFLPIRAEASATGIRLSRAGAR